MRLPPDARTAEISLKTHVGRYLINKLDGSVDCFGHLAEWHVDIVKSPRENEMGEKGLSCSDGFDYEPIFGKEAQQCVFLTRDGFANK